MQDDDTDDTEETTPDTPWVTTEGDPLGEVLVRLLSGDIPPGQGTIPHGPINAGVVRWMDGKSRDAIFSEGMQDAEAWREALPELIGRAFPPDVDARDLRTLTVFGSATAKRGVKDLYRLATLTVRPSSAARSELVQMGSVMPTPGTTVEGVAAIQAQVQSALIAELTTMVGRLGRMNADQHTMYMSAIDKVDGLFEREQARLSKVSDALDRREEAIFGFMGQETELDRELERAHTKILYEDLPLMAGVVLAEGKELAMEFKKK